MDNVDVDEVDDFKMVMMMMMVMITLIIMQHALLHLQRKVKTQSCHSPPRACSTQY